jgi:hypothetical protein
VTKRHRKTTLDVRIRRERAAGTEEKTPASVGRRLAAGTEETNDEPEWDAATLPS